MDAIAYSYTGVEASLDSSGNIVLTDVSKGDSATTISLSLADGATGQVTLPTFSESVRGRDAATHTISTTVYDSLGDTHTVSLTFTPTDTVNQWTWTSSVTDGTVQLGGTGAAAFNNDGSLKGFYNGSMTFTPANGADEVSVTFNAGTGFDGLTQFDSPSDTMATGQDGYASGSLETVTIGEDGVVEGLFSNGMTRSLARIALAGFENPNGLLSVGQNMYKISSSSGQPVVGQSGREIDASVRSGYLESSNVDMAQQLTEMIMVQRGIQANIRAITTADAILGELVNIKR